MLTLGVSFILGMLISITYMKTFTKNSHSQGLVLTLIMLPTIISIVILLVGSNVARAFSLAGVFSIIRFRSSMGDPKDIAYIFFAVAAGLACGAGLLGYAAIFTIILCVLMILLSLVNFGSPKGNTKVLKITIAEDMEFEGVFDDIFEKYTHKATIRKARTADLGTLYEVVFDVVMKKDVSEKQFIDELRVRNGNLNIILNTKIYGYDQ